MKSEMGNMSEKLEAMRNAVAEDGGQFPKNEAKLLILQVRLTFNNVFFIAEEISNFMTF